MKPNNDPTDAWHMPSIDLATHTEYTIALVGSVYHVKKMLLANDAGQLDKIGVKRVNIESDGSLRFYFEKTTPEQDKTTKDEIMKMVSKYSPLIKS